MSPTDYFDVLCIIDLYKKRVVISDVACQHRIEDACVVSNESSLQSSHDANLLSSSISPIRNFNIYKIASMIYDTEVKNDFDLSKIINNGEPKKSFFRLFGYCKLFIFDAHDLSLLHWKFIHKIMDSNILVCVIQDSSQSIYKQKKI
jgi:hypothetical protein